MTRKKLHSGFRGWISTCIGNIIIQEEGILISLFLTSLSNHAQTVFFKKK